jgi:predicted XRE-type DNA-binding protein
MTDRTTAKLNELATLTECGFPYVRGGTSDSHVKDLAVALVDGLAKEGRIPEDFLRDMIVMRLPEPAKDDPNKKLVKEWDAGRRAVAINGNHRLLAIRLVNDSVRPNKANGIKEDALPIEKLTVDSRSPMSVSQMKITQLTVDMKTGLKITTEQREQTIMGLYHEDKLSQTELAKVFGLTQASISRIIAGKQTLKQLGLASGRRPRRKKTTKKSGKRTTFDVFAFLDDMMNVARDAARREAKLLTAMDAKTEKKRASAYRTFATLITKLADRAEAAPKTAKKTA